MLSSIAGWILGSSGPEEEGDNASSEVNEHTDEGGIQEATSEGGSVDAHSRDKEAKLSTESHTIPDQSHLKTTEAEEWKAERKIGEAEREVKGPSSEEEVGKQPVMEDPLTEKEKNISYIALEFCVPHFPVGVVVRYNLPGVYRTICEIPTRDGYAGFESPPKETIFDFETFEFPVDLARRLLELDQNLAMLRYKLSKRRISEKQFWHRYFNELVITLRNYVCRPA
mmetsp:Transcript_9457/g.13187  ORF Transcript_9457/g.13187 Transcript_9457/m.13187 type:complete len:226 (-) Transcript_9457:109-786(-)|eukprot:CAMPEP_0184479018 /NCGR_PEP_ID=MMETSP0113_2-20130426/883_1 /TAXON_ID=91329 /ORGANISM="Norrisiella sphaerica, Strain BC52" /LENGTH=225 /DNA_ID=CAMNT_0026856995 /DNA_START=296 /DNA_END=973 /DNA_ORIENTATION=-